MKRYARGPARAARGAARSPRRCSRGFPIGINALAIILYLRAADRVVRDRRRVAGALAAGAGIGAPVAGAARRPVRRSGACSSRSRSSTPPRWARSSALRRARRARPRCSSPVRPRAGFAIPPTSSVLRSMWPTLLRGRAELLQAAYALDSMMIELIFILGPLLTAVLAAVSSPAGALIVSAASVITGTVVVHRARRRAARSSPTARRAASRLGALVVARRAHRWCSPRCPPGVGIGMVEVGLPAFCRRRGRRRLAGAAARGVVARQRAPAGCSTARCRAAPPLRRPAPRRRGAAPARRCCRWPPRRRSPVMALLVIPAGCFIAPLLATRNELSAASRRRARAPRPTRGR